MKNPFIESEKLYFFRPDDSDYEFLVSLLRNPVLTRHIAENITEEQIANVVNRTKKQWEDYGFGTCVVVLKETGNRIGFGGPKYYPPLGKEIIDIGGVTLQEYHGKGLAKEGFKACVEYCNKHLPDKKIACLIAKDNVVVRNMLEKFGYKMVCYMSYEYDGIKHENNVRYELNLGTCILRP